MKYIIFAQSFYKIKQMEHIIITEENFLKLLDEVQKYLTTDLQYIKTQYLTDDDILNLFRLSSKKYLVQFRKRTGIPFRKIGGTYLYKTSEILDFIENQNRMKPNNQNQ